MIYFVDFGKYGNQGIVDGEINVPKIYEFYYLDINSQATSRVLQSNYPSVLIPSGGLALVVYNGSI